MAVGFEGGGGVAAEAEVGECGGGECYGGHGGRELDLVMWRCLGLIDLKL